MNIGFIGTGVMGSSMASHLGEQLYIYNRTKKKAESLIANGAIWCDDIAGVAKQSDIIFTMLGYPEDVESVYLGEDSLIANGKLGQIMIDCTTSSPALARRIYNAAQLEGIGVLDAPVSGGDVGASNATLTIMIGGDAAICNKVTPLLSRIGTAIQYFGPAGSGQHAKMANQIAIATNMIGVAESLYYAKRSGLDVEKVLQTISQGAAGSWSLSNLAPRMLNGDFAPGFYTHHFLKDMKIALQEAEQMAIELPGLQLAYELYNSLSNDIKQSCGTQVIYQSYKEN